MKRLFNPENIRLLIQILVTMLFVKLAWFLVELTSLSSQGVEYTKNIQSKALYYRAKFASQKLEEKKKPLRNVSDIRNIKLHAIYHSNEHLVITVSKNRKSSVLVRGDQIDGYVLDDATEKEAIFVKNGKHYKIRLVEVKPSPNSRSSVTFVEEKTGPQGKSPVEEEGSGQEESIIQSGAGYAVVNKNLLKHYTDNFDDIWKNIGLKEIKEGNQIKGFKVNFVKRGSDFAKLGLRRGDLIKRINGEVLDSYQKAFAVYKNIDDISDLTLTIMRGNQEMELEYEIR